MSIINEIHGDLFNGPKSSLAHCVASDLKMGAGIAVLFKKKFKGLDKLKEQVPKVGSICVLERNSSYIYYLITKKYTKDYPTLDTIKSSLTEMRNHAVKHDIKSISMPRIGSGLDKLDWNDVKNIIIEVFTDTDIVINVFYL